jgi:hypothetical protein
MIEILKYVQPKTVFDPEFIQVLASAFDDAWNRIEESGSRFARPGYARAMREVIAKRIIESAQRGVKDLSALADDTVQFFTAFLGVALIFNVVWMGFLGFEFFKLVF